MRVCLAIALVAAAMLTGCGGSDEPEKSEEPMKVEDTVFGPLVGTPDKAQDRTDAAIELHRENLDRRLEADEGVSGEEPPED